MEMEIKYLRRLDERVDGNGPGNDEHPMRKVTRQVAFEQEGWTPQRAAKVTELFDEMAETWQDKDFESRVLPVLDAIKRGGISRGTIGLELGCGTGAYSTLLASHFDCLLCADISFEMLTRVVAPKVCRLRTDGALLPVSSGSVHGLFCINTLLFPREVERILSPDGFMAWISTSGDQTPIYLSPGEVYEALGGKFTAISSEAGPGTWSVFRRR